MNNFDTISSQIFESIIDMIDSIKLNTLDADIEENILYINTEFGQYIINKHYINKEIWMSSPISGAHHFKHIDGNIFVNGDKKNIIEILQDEICGIK